MSATINAGKCPVSRVQEHNGGNAMASTYDSPTGWYTELEPNEKRTFWACFGGWMLDAMDVQIFSFAIPAIIVAFAITNADAGLIGTVTLLTSPGAHCSGSEYCRHSSSFSCGVLSTSQTCSPRH